MSGPTESRTPAVCHVKDDRTTTRETLQVFGLLGRLYRGMNRWLNKGAAMIDRSVYCSLPVQRRRLGSRGFTWWSRRSVVAEDAPQPRSDVPSEEEA